MASAGSLFVNIGARTRGLSKGLRRAQRSVDRAARKMERAGKAMTAALSAPLSLAGAASVREFAKYEEAVTEIQKVTSKGTAGALQSDLKTLSNRLPQTSTELANLAADAGRFGVEGPENILAFTESVSKMAAATDLSTDQAGESFAKLATLTNTPVSEVENLGSSINELSNNMATSSSEIVDSMTRSAGALESLGASNTEITALSATLNEVSESSERAGTRMRRLAQELMEPKKVQDLAGALGMTTGAFKQMRSDAPVKLIQRMAQSMAEGGASADKLRSALSSTSRQALTGLSQNLSGLNKALSTSGRAFEENTSLQQEFDAAMGTLNKQAQVLWGQIKNLGISIGRRLVPAVRKAMSAIQGLIKQFQSLSSATKTWIVAAGAAATAIGPLILAGTKLVTLFKTLGTVASTAWAAATSPVTAVVAAVGAVAGGAYLVIKNWTQVSHFFQRMWSTLESMFDAGVTLLTNPWQRAWAQIKKHTFSAVESMLGMVQSLLEKLPDSVVPDGWTASLGKAQEQMSGFVDGAKTEVESLQKGFQAAQNKLSAAWEDTLDGMQFAASGTWSAIGGEFSTLMSSMKGMWQDFRGAFTPGSIGGGGQGQQGSQRAQAAGTQQVQAQGSLVGNIPQQVQGIKNANQKIEQYQAKVRAAKQESSTWGKIAKGAIRRIQGGLQRAFGTIKGVIQGTKSMGDVFKSIGSSIVSALTSVIAKLTTVVTLAGVLSATGLGGVVGAGGSFGSIVGSFLGLAEGGLVTGPTVAAVGEGPRTGPSNPEVVAPLNKLEKMVGKGGGDVHLHGELAVSLDELLFRLKQRDKHNNA